MAQSAFPTSYVTGGAVGTPERETPTDGAPACPACPHAAADHDAISLRFCQATAAGSSDRGCICRS